MAAPIAIGSKRELFVDDYLIENMNGVSLKLHHPVEREVVITCDKPWEGACSAYFTVMKDGDTYRMYYRGAYKPTEVTCYAESKDGVNWTRPTLGLFEFNGSKENNIVWMGKGAHNFTPFKDTNPTAPDSERYKALASAGPKGSLVAFASADGIHWRKLQEEPVITHGAFDSQNLAFYDPMRKCYMAYYRGFTKGVRAVLHASSTDFIHWNDAEMRWIDLGDTPPEHLYTNGVTPYFRAPHIYIALPARFAAGHLAPPYPDAPTRDCVSDAVFMSSRDGYHFDRRFMEAFIRPGLDKGRWVTRNNYPAWGIVPTKSAEIGGLEELSIYWTEHYYTPKCRLRRGTLRLDGFVSVNAPYKGGEFVTKPIVFEGKALVINYSTSAVGSIRVEIQDAQGRPIPGYNLKTCTEIYGDDIEQTVQWKNDANLSRLAGTPIRLRFVMKDADLYSFQFKH